MTLEIGSYSVTIPAGSFKRLKNGSNRGNWLYEGTIDGTTLQIQIEAFGGNAYEFKAQGDSVNFTGIANPINVKITIGSNTGSVNVNAQM